MQAPIAYLFFDGNCAEGGRINMPVEKTFFAEAFGMLVDRYGTPWMIMARTAPG